MRRLFAALALAIAFSGAHAQAPASDADLCSLPSQNLDLIIQSCTRALANAGSDDEYRAGILQLRAIAYARKGDPDRAIADLDVVIKIQPKGSTYAIRGMQWQAKKLDRNAIADFDAATRLEGEKPVTLFRRAFSYGNLREDAKALADLNRAIQLDPRYLSAYLARGLVKYRNDDQTGAIADFDFVLRFDPTSKAAIDFRAKAVAELKGEGSSANSVWASTMKAGEDASKRNDLIRAERAYETALTQLTEADNRGSDRLVENLMDLLNIKLRLAKLEEAERLAQRVLAVDQQRFPPDNHWIGARLVVLAEVMRLRGRPAEALKVSQRALAIHEKDPGPSSKSLTFSLNEVAQDMHALGDYRGAEAMYRRALAVTEKAFGQDSESVATVLNNLAALLNQQGRSEETLAMYRRSFDISAKLYGANSPRLITTISNFAATMVERGYVDQAEGLYKRVVDIAEKAYGPDHPEVANTLINLAAISSRNRKYAEQEAMLKRALPILTKSYGEVNPSVIEATYALGASYYEQKRAKEALPLFIRGTDSSRKMSGTEAPEVAFGLYWQSHAYAQLGDLQNALATARGATAISVRRNRLSANDLSVASRSEQKTYTGQYRNHLGSIYALQQQSPAQLQALAPEAFQMLQTLRVSDTASAIANMATRFSKGDSELSRLVRTRQDTLRQWQEIDAKLISASTQPPERRNQADERSMQNQVKALEAKAADVSQALESKFPEYKALTSDEPTKLSDAQALLGEKEAILSYVVDFDKTYVMVVRRNKFFLTSLPIGRADLAKRVATLRRSLDPDGASDSFPMGAAHDLYKVIFAPAEESLQGAEQIMLVPDGPLSSLPLGILISAPAPDDRQDGAYAKAQWLARKYAFSTLPSEGSLRALRQFAKRASGDEPFQGFGNPVLEGDGTNRNRAPLAKLMPRGGVADVREVRKLAPLPETAIELGAFAKFLGAGPQSVHTGAAATEARVKSMDLSRARVVAFATHGLVAGDLEGVLEPALALTPPAIGTELDDGLLTASEIAQLKLNADWVILSACNTAASDGTSGGEGLSGLAKAFFYAGSRTLVVSHWPVASVPTVFLTTRMFKESTAPGIGKAEALRRSMVAMIENRENPELAHPIFWAPFVVVGEGR